MTQPRKKRATATRAEELKREEESQEQPQTQPDESQESQEQPQTQPDESQESQEQSQEGQEGQETQSERAQVEEYRPSHPQLENAGLDQHSVEETRQSERKQQRDEHNRRTAGTAA